MVSVTYQPSEASVQVTVVETKPEEVKTYLVVAAGAAILLLALLAKRRG
jgi:hypothetical protein